jgi:hypothetical protein
MTSARARSLGLIPTGLQIAIGARGRH